MKKIIIVNNNMKIGGVQKSLCNLLWAIEKDYDITLSLFRASGELLDTLPPSVKVIESKGPFRLLGMSQSESKSSVKDYLLRAALALHSRVFGRSSTLGLMLKYQPKLPDKYDFAISYLHNGRRKAFYGGTQEYVLHCINADKKIAFLHADYVKCGANHKENDALMESFDVIAACSEGCKAVFDSALPHLADRCHTVCNCHNFDLIKRMASDDPIIYDESYVNVITVSRISHEKGLDRAIRSLERAVLNGCKVKLHIVGGGPKKAELEQLVDELNLNNNVSFYGEQKNPYKYMKNADLLLLSSYHEAAPMVIDEALCLGVPTLTTKTTSSKDMVEDRACGWVCENTDEALIEAFCRVVSDKGLLKTTKERLQSFKVHNELAVGQLADILSK